MHRVWGSTSTITAVRPAWITGKRVVDQPTAGTNTSSPGCSRPSATRAAHSSRLADEPELTITACSLPAHAAKAASKRSVRPPMVTQVVIMASVASMTSSGPKPTTCRGMPRLASCSVTGRPAMRSRIKRCRGSGGVLIRASRWASAS
jgi:hypothetical protein